MSVHAATSGAVFHAYLERVLLPALRERKPDAVPVMDNLGAHKTLKVRELLDGSGFPYRYLPSYSPDLAGLGAGQGRAAPGGRAHPGGAVPGARPGARPGLRRQRRGLLPPLRLPASRLTRGSL